MKKFLNIRNILIILIILIVSVYIIFMRSTNPGASKTSELFYKLINKDIITMRLSYEGEDRKENIIFSTNKNIGKTIKITELYDFSKEAKELNFSHIKNITIIENNKSHTFQLNYDLNNYIEFEEEVYGEELTDWIESINNIVSGSNYYVKGYKNINNTELFTETFPEQDYMFGYVSNELKYIKSKDGFSGNGNTMYEVELEEDFIDNSLLEIPNNFNLNN